MYRWVEHTAEIEIAIEANSEREVLEDALAALRELLAGGEVAVDLAAGGKTERRQLLVSARDRPALLAAWLEELVYLAESEGFVPIELESLAISDPTAPDTSLRVVVAGVLGAPPPLVKAVTYHRLAFERRGDRYVANVVLDV